MGIAKLVQTKRWIVRLMNEDNFLELAQALWSNVTPEEEKKMRSWDYCQISPEFPCFVLQYYSALSFVPTHWTIVDIGCYLAVQSYLYVDYKNYIGIDNVPIEYRVATPNSMHYELSFQLFKSLGYLEDLELNLKQTFAICNYVPDAECRKLVRETFPNCLIYYPSLASK